MKCKYLDHAKCDQAFFPHLYSEMEDLIVKYLNNELSHEERNALNQWLSKSNRNRKVFENIVNHWNISEEDVSEAKSRAYATIVSSNQPIHVSEKRVRSGWGILKYAAVVFLFLSVSIYLLKVNTSEEHIASVEEEREVVKQTSRGQMLSITLPDQTKVKLNAGSKLSYPERFDDDLRVVALEGEAFFEVTRDEERPFHIETEELDVEVLGTSFSVRTDKNDENPMVAVRSGKVMVREILRSKSVLLTQNQFAVLDNDALIFKDIDEYELFFGWVDKQLVFKEESLQEVLKKISKWFDVDFEVSKKFTNTRDFTGSYDNPTLNQVMQSLSFAYEFNYEIKNRIVKIY